MNSVYYIFLAIIVLSFVTGIIITIIDNKHGEPFENEVPVKKSKNAVKDVAVRSNSLSDTMKNNPVLNESSQSTVPYLPLEASQMIPALIFENPPVNKADNQIQINHNEEPEYFSVPVLVPMDDDAL